MNLLTQMINFPTQSCYLFVSSDGSICSICSTVSPPLGNSDHVVVLVSIDFPSNSKRDAPFHCIAYDFSRADCDSFCDHLSDVLSEDILNLVLLLLLVNFVSWFRLELMYIPLIVNVRSSLTHLHGFHLLVRLP